MNTNNGALYFGAGIDRTQWRRDIDAMRRDILGLSQTTVQETRNMKSAFDNLSLGIAGVFSVDVIKSFVMEVINVRGEFQKTEIAFSTMLGNAQQAKGLMGQMVELAEKTPFSLQDVSSGAKQLLAFQVPASEVVDTLTRMGNIAAGLGVPLSRINLVYGQVKAKGKLAGDDLRQFTEAGIPMVAELAKKFGKSTAEISAMVSAGKIGFKDVQDVLFSLTNQGGMFYNLMEKQSKSLSGQIANLGDAWDQMLNKIGESNEGMLSDGIQGLTYLIEHYKDVIQIISTLVAAYGTYRAVLITVNALQRLQIWTEGTVAAVRFAQGISGMTRAQLLFNAAANANPYILLASGIAAVVAALVYLRSGNFDAKEETEKLTDAMEYQKAVSDSIASAYKKSSEQLVGSINKEITILKSSYSTVEMRKKSYENLIKLNKTFVGTVDGEYRATIKLSDAYTTLVSRLKELSIAKGKAALLEELSKKKAQAELDLVFKEEEYEKQRLANARKRAENEKKTNIGAGMYREYKLNEGIEYTAYNPVKQARKAAEEVTKQVNRLADDVAKGIADATKKNDKKLLDNWNNLGEEVLSTGPKKGTQRWYEEEVKRLQEANKDLQVGSKEWNKNLTLIERYNDLMKAPKGKKDSRQLAEIIPEGSVKELQRRATLIKEAIDTAVDGQVRLRKLDKYGSDKDKKGNPYYTGEIISLEEADRRYNAIQDRIKQKQLQNVEERVNEAERQWNNYYRMAEVYGKKTADAQYKDLFNGAENYLDFLKKQEQALLNLSNKGMLTNQQRQDLIFITDKIKNLTGIDTPFENVKKGIESALKNIPSLVDQLEFINKSQDLNKFLTGGKSNTFFDQNKFFEGLKEGVMQQQRDLYSQFEKEHQTFEQRKTEITQNYDLIRANIQKQNISDVEKARLTAEANKAETKEISATSFEAFQKTDLWVKAFGDLSKIGPKTLLKLKKGLQDYLNSEKGKSLAPTEVKETQEQLKKLDDLISSNNPYVALGIAVDAYKKKRQELNDVEKKAGKGSDEYQQKLEETQQAFVNIVEVTGAAAKATIEVVGTIGDAFGGLSDDLKQTLAEVQQLIDGIVNTVAGYFSGNYGQMISGIVQIVGAMVKLLSGDKGRERQIREWQTAVDELKTSYNELQYAIEKTAGEASLSMNRGLIENLEEQKRLLIQMRDEESKKKKSDAGKIATLNDQISQVNQQINDVLDNFKKSITTTEFKELATKLADALVEGFGKGEDAALSFEKVVDEVMRNAVINALKVRILEPAMESFVDKLYSSMGYGNGNANANDDKIKEYESKIAEIDKKIKDKESQTYTPYLAQEVLDLKKQRQDLLDIIGKLKAAMAATPAGGAFDGLTQEEIDKLKEGPQAAIKEFTALLSAVQAAFPTLDEVTQSLKGDIKGITEKTAGALEGQVNAMRIMQAEALKHQKNGFEVMRNQLFVQVQIEQNTRPIEAMYKEIKDLNSKIKPGLAGIP